MKAGPIKDTARGGQGIIVVVVVMMIIHDHRFKRKRIYQVNEDLRVPCIYREFLLFNCHNV